MKGKLPFILFHINSNKNEIIVSNLTNNITGLASILITDWLMEVIIL